MQGAIKKMNTYVRKILYNEHFVQKPFGFKRFVISQLVKCFFFITGFFAAGSGTCDRQAQKFIVLQQTKKFYRKLKIVSF